MAQQDKHRKAILVALAGAGLVFLVVDVLLLTLVVMPLTASTGKLPTGEPARPVQESELAFILPTRDPAMPRPTRAPAPTAAPWLMLSPTPETLPATLLPAENTALPTTTVTPAAPLAAEAVSIALPQSTLSAATPPEGAMSAAPSGLVTTPMPTRREAAMPASSTDTGPTPVEETPQPAETPVPADAPDATGTPPATATQPPAANPSATPQPPNPGSYDDLPDFETFLRMYRNTVAGQPFDVVSLTMDRTDGAPPRFVLQVVGSETSDVFAAQAAADVVAYGGRFLDDAESYLGDEYCAVAVESTYKTSNSDACSSAPAWCRVGDHDQAANTWTVTWTYVRGSSEGGPDTVEAWKTE